jgi:hypothetical protein
MFRIAKNAMAALALSGLVLSQPALAVRSSDSLPSPGVKVSGAATRVGTPMTKSDGLVGIPVIGLVVAGGVIIATILIVAKDKKKSNQSPG